MEKAFYYETISSIRKERTAPPELVPKKNSFKAVPDESCQGSHPKIRGQRRRVQGASLRWGVRKVNPIRRGLDPIWTGRVVPGGEKKPESTGKGGKLQMGRGTAGGKETDKTSPEFEKGNRPSDLLRGSTEDMSRPWDYFHCGIQRDSLASGIRG